MEGPANDDEKGGIRSAVSAISVPLIITFAAIAVVGGAYYAFYRSQVDYYTGRNLRLLSTLTAQINGRVAMVSNFFRDGILKPEKEKDQPIKDATPRKIEEPIQRQMVEEPRGWSLVLKDNNQRSVAVSIDEVLRPIFARRVSSAFDMVLVADETGNILFNLRTPPPASSLLGSEEQPLDAAERGLTERNARIVRTQNRVKQERESGAALVITRLDALWEEKGWRTWTSLKPAALGVATTQMTVRLGDDEYRLFAQPYTFAHAPLSPDKKAKRLIVCGLVSAPRFNYSVTAVSVSIVFIAIAAIFLLLCCWPFLRIAFIHSSQALMISDLALIAICTAVGACVLTLALLDAFSYRALAAGADKQLRKFSKAVTDDFGRNVKRAMQVLDAAETMPTMPSTQDLEKFTNSPAVAQYPYIDSIAWIDQAGKQQVRVGPPRVPPLPLFDVGYRQYFRNALHESTWTVAGRPYVLEWVRTQATGDVRAVLAKRTHRQDLPVIALSTDLIDLTHAVRPPGVQFAIIEENGDVVYHSDPERIGFENVFAETDRNRDLRSAVLARREQTVEGSYWGEDQSMHVSPIGGSPWTLVTFRAKRLLRVMNVEAALLTLVLLVMAAAPYVLLYIVTLILAPGYRAPSVWPDPKRYADYLRLCIIYLGLLPFLVLTAYVLTAWTEFFAVVLIQAIAALSTYLALHRGVATRTFQFATGLWIVANALLIFVLLTASGPGVAVRALLAAAAAGLAVLTRHLIWTYGGRRLERVGYATLYRLCGVLFLALCVVAPVAAFLDISREVQAELLVKYGQLRAAAELEERIDRLETLSVLPVSPPDDVRRPDLLNPIGGEWSWRLQRAGEKPCDPPAKTTELAELLPSMYEDSTAIRPLLSTGATDCLWRWSVGLEHIDLVRQVRFDPAVSRKLGTPEDQEVFIESPRAPAEENGLALLPPILLCGLGILAVLWYAVGFIASRVFLIDLTAPQWIAHLPFGSSLGDHIFLVRGAQEIPTPKDDDLLIVSFEEIARNDSWHAVLARLDRGAVGRSVRVVDFEYGIADSDVNLQKLQWLERLLSLPDRTVIVISALTPAFVMSSPLPANAPPDYLQRWRILFDRFVVVTAEQHKLYRRELERLGLLPTRSAVMRAEPHTWFEKETWYDPFLENLRHELEEFAEYADRAQLLDEIGERAESYYTGLWNSCRQEEQLLLYQLAHNGLANGRNRRALRRLIARGLVRRDPNLGLFSESFRLFVIAAAEREDLVRRARAAYGTSTWDSLRVPFFVVIISFLLLLFATQKDLLTTTTAFATALTTGLPMIMKLMGVFAQKRLGTSDFAK